MPHEPEPASSAITAPSLADYEARQAALYRALAQYQHAAAGEAVVHPGAFGLAVYHSLQADSSLETVLVHEDGGTVGSITRLGDETPDVELLAKLQTHLLLGAIEPVVVLRRSSAPAEAEQPAEPAPAPEPEPACPMPVLELPVQQPDVGELIIQGTAALQRAADPEPVTSDEPTAEEVEAALGLLDALHGTKPDAVAAILKAYKLEHQIGRQPFVKSLTTRARIETLQDLIAEHA
jgi:hypothetical protein